MDMDKGTQECTPLYSTGEEIANSVLHGIATLLSVAGLIVHISPCRTLRDRGKLQSE